MCSSLQGSNWLYKTPDMTDKVVGLPDHKVNLDNLGDASSSKLPFMDPAMSGESHAASVPLNDNGGVYISNEEMSAAFKMLDTDSSGMYCLRLLLFIFCCMSSRF